MPQASANSGTKQKSKGRQPAHQNKFAFRHNPKSKKTDKILASVNQHCCERCHDKIEWRKKYRKYKPRTQLGTCNLCRQKRVKAAYHTICTKCTTSDKAWKFYRESQVKLMGGVVSDLAATEEEEEEEEDEEETEVENKKLAATLLALASKPALRVCAVCVKEKAMRGNGGSDTDISEIVARMGPMSLRERRGLERQLMRQQEEAAGGNEEDAEEEEEEEPAEEENVETQDEAAVEEEQAGNDSDAPLEEEEDYREEEDPFLKAVGGSDKLLTGEAYQKKLLAQAGEKPTM